MRGRSVAIALLVCGVSTAALAKGHPARVEEISLSKTETFDGLRLPRRTKIELESRWDQTRGQYDAKQLASFTLPAELEACGTRLPAKVAIEVRRGLPAAVAAKTPSSTAVHLVWVTRVKMRIDERTVPVGSTVGVECSSHKLTVLVSSQPFEVDGTRVTSAAWYPAELGGGPLRFQFAESTELEGVHIPPGYVAAFRQDGHLLSLLGPARVGVKVGERICYTETWGDEIRFDDSGRATCAKEVNLRIPCDPAKPISLHYGSDAGQLSRCTLAAPFKLADMAWASGDEIRLAIDGRPLR